MKFKDLKPGTRFIMHNDFYIKITDVDECDQLGAVSLLHGVVYREVKDDTECKVLEFNDYNALRTPNPFIEKVLALVERIYPDIDDPKHLAPAPKLISEFANLILQEILDDRIRFAERIVTKANKAK